MKVRINDESSFKSISLLDGYNLVSLTAIMAKHSKFSRDDLSKLSDIGEVGA